MSDLSFLDNLPQETCLYRLLGDDIGDPSVYKKFGRWVALEVVHLWGCPDVMRRYLETGDESLMKAVNDVACDAYPGVCPGGRVAGNASQAAHVACGEWTHNNCKWLAFYAADCAASALEWSAIERQVASTWFLQRWLYRWRGTSDWSVGFAAISARNAALWRFDVKLADVEWALES